MSTDKDTKKVIMLVVFGVILALGAFILALWLLFGEEETKGPVQEETYFPEGSTDSGFTPLNESDEAPQIPTELPTDTATDTPSEEVVIEPVSDWRDDVVEYETHTPVSVQEENTNPVPVTFSDTEINPWSYTPPPPPPTPPPVVTPILISTQPPDNFPELEESSFSSCGSVSIPSTESGLERFLSDFDDDRVAICLGEAVADNCDASRARLTGPFAGYLYVAERNDGVCSIGGSSADDPNVVSLCSVEVVMNESRNEIRSFSYWEDEFDDDPGQAFADAFRGPPEDVVSVVNWSVTDCQVFEL